MRFTLLVTSIAIFSLTVALAFGDPQTAAKTKVVPKKAKTANTSGSKKRVAAKKIASRPAAAARQLTPSSDRYKEIQQALAEKGYLKTEPSGVWDAGSVAAMRQFQTDRKLDSSGKVTAASLIDLGLGPSSAGSQTPATGPGGTVPEQPKVPKTEPVTPQRP